MSQVELEIADAGTKEKVVIKHSYEVKGLNTGDRVIATLARGETVEGVVTRVIAYHSPSGPRVTVFIRGDDGKSHALYDDSGWKFEKVGEK